MPDPSNEALTVAVTGASGALGQALLRRWHRRGARLIALTHSPAPLQLAGPDGQQIPLRQVHWQVGQEAALESLLEGVDLLVINHGINVHGDGSAEATGRSLEVNALSAWRLLELFAVVVQRREPAERDGRRRPEVWVNTSEAEIQPAVSPLYEISKRLLGQLLSLRAPELAQALRLRRLVLGPFRSALNPVGVMGADWVAGEILRQADWNCSLIIVTPNPLTFVLMPLATLTRWAYMSLLLRR
ncbi:NAD-dependent epimerase/dehydratase family protein [Synechococcus sp. BO 8801]|uniref:NAD-dependent epimerase/dehydratase family protein n=1 Tax=Synechococcus sp. BO 8801 TaxID=169670 RepID=UPI000B981B6A|nr:NAD-dependent epimerase/dehydratase family protein [Synechococcus sp. BO 8801]